MTSTITESKFTALKAKLRELFELDKSDLDFGIYRIMAAKNKDVTAFLDRHLRETVREVLSSHGAGKAAAKAEELKEAIQSATALGVDPDAVPKVKELRKEYERLGGETPEELEADIYNHLLNFFSRYYDEGDFISKRYYRGDTYAIPYGGEEVTLHWANKDQYYIKSGEWHKDYRFRIGDRAVHFRLITASQETGNNKESDESKRRYILSAESPVHDDSKAKVLTLRFEFRAPTEADKSRIATTECTRIFGGKYDSGKNPAKGDDREQFCADAEMRALTAISEKWKKIVSTLAATEGKPARTLLGKHIDHFTARNSFDYFIHKDLGGFLSRELDFYIKNEVVRLDDLEALDENHLIRVQGKVKAIRQVAKRVVDFLASVENFQKKLWLKKKFVLEANWCISLDKIPTKFWPLIISNARQIDEWKTLFQMHRITGDLHVAGFSEPLNEHFLSQNNLMSVNTRHFDKDFSQSLLTHIEAIHEKTNVVLVNGENAQANRLLGRTYDRSITAIYADPPYNTDASEIMYKNGFRNSSWLAFLAERLVSGFQMLSSTGICCLTIDDFEFHRARSLCELLFGKDQVVGVIAIKNNPSGRATGKGFAIAHEYAVFTSASPDFEIGRLRHSEDQLERYNYKDQLGAFEWVNFRKHGGANANRWARRKLYYPIFVSSNGVRFPELTWNDVSKEWDLMEAPKKDEEIVYPITPDGEEKTWKWGIETAIENPDEFCSRPDSTGKMGVYRKARLNEAGTLPRTLWDKSEYSSTEYGTNLLKKIFGESEIFSFPKSVHAVSDCLRVCNVEKNGLVIDFFAGSGTTAHAVFALNREDNGSRKSILVEMGEYVEKVTSPRVRKTAYSANWNDGLPDRDQGLSLILKQFSLESYEDALNNLPSPDGKLFESLSDDERHSLITYSLDLELGPQLLNMDAFNDPWGYKIYAQLAGDDEVKLHKVDLVETFNYLIGLKVNAYGPMEHYSAEFDRMPHGDDLKSGGEPKPESDRLGRIRVKGRLRRSADGPFVFQRVEGELNDDNATRVLVIWRKLTDEPDKDAAVLEAWMQRHREDTKERSQHRDYHIIYINGPVTLPQPTQDIRTVFPLEQTFKDRMFEDTE